MEFAFEVIRAVKNEQPELFDSLHVNVKMLDEAISAMQFAEDVLKFSVTGLSRKDMRTYLEFCADQRLITQLSIVYRSTNPFQFMELQDVQELTNFFERRVSAYQVGIEGTVSFNEDF